MITAKKKIAYITATRADFGIITPVLQSIQKSKQLRLKIYVTGMHMMNRHGNTARDVKKIFKNPTEIQTQFNSGDHMGTTNFIAQYIKKISNIFYKDTPDFVLLLGDRPEALATAMSCLYLGIPTGHIHGGEISSTVDGVARHAITKLSCLHFPATHDAAKRIKKLGEEPWRIHTVGAPSLDTILNEKLPTKKILFNKFNLNLKQKILLVTQHPVSAEWEAAGNQMRETIDAIKSLKITAIIVYPNSDIGGRLMINEIQKEKNNPLFRIVPSVEYKYFLALERESSVWIGNSSGAMIESSSFKIPAVNVGTRQEGRQHGDNVLNVIYDRNEIKKAVEKSLYDKKYLKILKNIKNPWGDGKTSQRITNILENLPPRPKLLKKHLLYD